ILPAATVAAVVFDRNQIGFRCLYSVLLAFITVLGVAYFLSLQGHSFMPTLTSNGPLNLFLGNNPSLDSFRGGADGVEWSNYDPGQYVSAIINFLVEQPISFFQNFLKKILFWLAPFDSFRSGIGIKFYFVLFLYVAVAQLICYYMFFLKIKGKSNSILRFGVWIFVSAWLAYAIFFVRIRYRIPFDSLLLILAFANVKLKKCDFFNV
ncbi:MAG: hypothetical protein RL018_1061, partial [Pseudomonadota bacterium]